MHKTSLKSKIVGDTRAVDIFNYRSKKRNEKKIGVTLLTEKKMIQCCKGTASSFPGTDSLLPPPAPTIPLSRSFQKNLPKSSIYKVSALTPWEEF